MNKRKEVQAILMACMDEFPNSGFVIIKTDVNESTGKTKIDWISNHDQDNTIDVLKGTQIMITAKEN